MIGTRGSLITCAQHITEELSLKYGGLAHNQYIVFILQISRRFDSSLSGLSCSQSRWDYTHLDDLRDPDAHTPSLMKYLDRPMSDIFREFNNDVGAGGPSDDLSALVVGSFPVALKTLNTMKETNIDTLASKIKVIKYLCEKNRSIDFIIIYFFMMRKKHTRRFFLKQMKSRKMFFFLLRLH